jgi:hypothetical protein
MLANLVITGVPNFRQARCMIKNPLISATTTLALLAPALSGCYSPYPIASTTVIKCDDGRAWFSGPVSETKTISTKLGVIQATRAGLEWEVTVVCKYPSNSPVQYNIVNGDGTSVKILKFRPTEHTKHEVVPVSGGVITFAYANLGVYAGSELRVSVIEGSGAVVHKETLR